MTSTGDYLTWQSLPLTGPHRSAEGSQSVQSARQLRHRRSLRFPARPGHWPAFALCRTNKTLITVFCKRFEEELCGLLAGGFEFPVYFVAISTRLETRLAANATTGEVRHKRAPLQLPISSLQQNSLHFGIKLKNARRRRVE